MIDWLAALLVVVAGLFHGPPSDSDLKPVDCVWAQGDWNCRI